VKKLGKWFVLKGLKPEYRNQTFYEGLLHKEFEIGKSLDHPNLVSIIEKYSDEQHGNCIVMEYIQGRPLRDFFSSKPSMQLATRLSEKSWRRCPTIIASKLFIAI